MVSLGTKLKSSGLNYKMGNKSNYYFDNVTQQAIEDFVVSDDEGERNMIYNEFIRPSFEKLVDGLIFSYKFKSTFGYSDLKNDCITFLYESMGKFDPKKGSRAFSYFNVVAKHYLIGKSIAYNKKVKEEIKFIDQNSRDSDFRKENLSQECNPSPEDIILDKEFFYVVMQELDGWKEKYFNKPTEKIVIDAVATLMKRVEYINIHNKKAVYMYLKELTGLNSKQLMINLNKLRKKYRFTKRLYYEDLNLEWTVPQSAVSSSIEGS